MYRPGESQMRVSDIAGGEMFLDHLFFQISDGCLRGSHVILYVFILFG